MVMPRKECPGSVLEHSRSYIHEECAKHAQEGVSRNVLERSRKYIYERMPEAMPRKGMSRNVLERSRM
jgi:hypothetical protein